MGLFAIFLAIATAQLGILLIYPIAYPGSEIKVYVLSPEIDHGSHIYGDGRLCLYSNRSPFVTPRDDFRDDILLGLISECGLRALFIASIFPAPMPVQWAESMTPHFAYMESIHKRYIFN